MFGENKTISENNYVGQCHFTDKKKIADQYFAKIKSGYTKKYM